MTSTTHAYFLVAHGSRRPQSPSSLQTLADYFREAIRQACSPPLAEIATPWVTTGYLEFQATSLAEQLVKFYRSLPPRMDKVHILPIFLLPGNHVREDIPLAIQAAQETLQSHQSTAVSPFVLRPHLGRHPQLKAIIQANMTRYDPDAWILIGHGSRRPEGNVSIQQLASQLQAIPAFWAVQPSFSDQVKTLVAQGIRSIGVIPYFLFPGKITDAIAAQAEELSRQYPDLTLRILSPLNPTPQLANALLDLSQSPILGAALQAKAM